MARGQGPGVPLTTDQRAPQDLFHPRPGVSTLQATKEVWGLPGRRSQPRWRPGTGEWLGADVGKDLLGRGGSEGAGGEGPRHAVAFNDKTEPWKAGPCPHLGPDTAPQGTLNSL